MGLLDFLFGRIKCPLCETKGARKTDFGVRCPNPSCQYFDPTLGRSAVLRAAGIRSARRADFSPARPVAIQYRNFRGQQRTFTAEADSIRRKKNHIIARVKPTGENISLARDRILNLTEVESDAPEVRKPDTPQPNGRERQVLAYHKKYKSTSPLYEKIRAKYPNW
jgi:hypothetical protein